MLGLRAKGGGDGASPVEPHSPLVLIEGVAERGPQALDPSLGDIQDVGAASRDVAIAHTRKAPTSVRIGGKLLESVLGSIRRAVKLLSLEPLAGKHVAADHPFRHLEILGVSCPP